MDADFEAERDSLRDECEHWRRAAVGLTDLDVVASAGAWRSLESYLGLSIRSSLEVAADRVVAQAAAVAAEIAAAAAPADLARLRAGILALRDRYDSAEFVIDFYGDAINTRVNPRIGGMLRGLDALAVDGMDRVLRPLAIDVPPVITYLDKGRGASVLRAGSRLWDSSLAPVAAIKITRHNVTSPSSIMHEAGHQISALTGWADELGALLHARLAPSSVLAAETWQAWASEVAADVYCFASLGYAPVPALATVVDGRSAKVFAVRFGDPHPFGWIRVLFNVALCRSWYGPGPWDTLGRAWMLRHDLRTAPPDSRAIAEASLKDMATIVDACTRAPMRSLGGQSLASLVDPRRVSPTELQRFAARAGASLYTSSYLQRLESMRVLAWTIGQGRMPGAGDGQVERWLRTMGGESSLAA